MALPTAEQQTKICQFIKAGASQVAAAAGCGVVTEVFWHWMEHIPEFRAAVEGAEGEARVATQVELRKKNPAAWLGKSARSLPYQPPGLLAQTKGGKQKRGLNYRQARFVMEYLKDGNGTQAAIRAGYAENGAEVHAFHLLRLPKIQDKICAARAELDKQLNLSVERVLREYMRIGFLDPAELFDEAGNLPPLKEIPADARRAITGIEVEELFDFDRGTKTQVGVLRKIRFASKIPALDALARHLGILRDKLELTGKDGGPLTITQVRDRILAEDGD